ncbi:DNA cytosine methyltransferase [Mesobacillus sp. S13]|uniref:DNA cytosine methyltransferase n=1 Tax=Mesobacillus sp. S13 TaxID=2880221 RepID=UPI001CF1F203|nr:DNA (cytosine-5-)-methyltransferase [Mesobacillus sp. S13]
MTYTVVDLLAGIGGMSRGFIEAGCRVNWAIDIDKDACEVFKYNHPNIIMNQGDIRNTEITIIPDCDILTSGLPVQPFSNNKNTERPFNSIDNYIITKVLTAKQPAVVLFETVKNLLTINNGQYLTWIIEELKNQGYYITYKIMNAKDYANLPYNKERLYIVGFREKLSFDKFTFPKGIPLEQSLFDTINVREKKEDSYYYWKDSNKYDFLHEIITEEDSIYQIRGFDKRNKNYISYKNICPSLTYRFRDNFILDDYGIRNLTIQEYIDITGLKKFKLPNYIGKQKGYRLVSNASITPLIRRIANHICFALSHDGISDEITPIHSHTHGESEVFLKENTTDNFVDNQAQNINGKEKKKKLNDGLKDLMQNVENARNNIDKGKALEVLIKKFFEQVEGFKVNTNKRTLTEEIDIQIRNESNSEFWRKETILFIGECKNWSKKAGKNELVIFKNKIENRRGRVGVGFFISWNGFSTTFTNEGLRSSKENLVIIPIDGNQIKEAIDSKNIEEFIKGWYTEAVMS